MPATPPPAPSDHFSRDRAELAQLGLSLARLRRALPLLQRAAGGAHHGTISACAALLAYLPTRWWGLNEGFWAAITAISVAQAEFQATESTAKDQFIGAAIGGTIGVGVSFAPGPTLLIYAAAIIVSMWICWALNVASASRLAAVTATIILLVPHTGSAERMFLSRLGEVGWGVCVAVAVVWLAGRLPARYGSSGRRSDGDTE